MEDFSLPELDDKTLMDILQVELDAVLPVEQTQASNTTPSELIVDTTPSEDNQVR
jgi:hypothetical protein